MGLVRLNGPGGGDLRSATQLVDNINEQVVPYLEEAEHVIQREQGVGLAAPQIGVPYSWYIDTMLKVYINPELVPDPDAKEERVFEGCLSIPERRYATKRMSKVGLSFTNIDGNHELLQFNKLSAWVAQHECDHLRGVLVCDHGERVYKGDE